MKLKDLNILRFLRLTLLLCLAFSCKRQTLELPQYILAYIPITIDWSESEVAEDDIVNVSAYFYPDDGSDPVVVVSSNKNYLLAQLPIGSYHALIFNEIKGNIAGTTFYEGVSRGEFHVGSKQVSPSSYVLYKPISPEYMIDNPDAVGSWASSSSVDITTETISFTRSSAFAQYISSIKASASNSVKVEDVIASAGDNAFSQVFEQLSLIKPQPVTVTCTITLGVINLSNAQRIEAVVRGLSNKVNLASRNSFDLESGDEPVHIFDFDTKYYNSSEQIDGYVKSSFLTFGKQPFSSADKYEIYITAILASGEGVYATYDVTDQVNASVGSHINIDLTSEQDLLELPEGIADGFGLEDWGEFENVEVH